MKKEAITWIALGLGLALAMVALPGSRPDASGQTALPLLTLLFIDEFGFILTAVGAAMGFRTLRAGGPRFSLLAATAGCILLALMFVWHGVSLWVSHGVG